jgi:hypothetical protein
METKVHDFTIKTDTAPFLEAYQFSAVFFTRAKCLFNFSIAPLDLLDSPGKLSRITSITTVGDRYNQPF